MAQGQCDELLAPAIEEWIAADHERAGSQSGQGCEDRIEVALGAGEQDMELQPEGAGRGLQVSRIVLGIVTGRVDEQGKGLAVGASSCRSSSRFGPTSAFRRSES